ncbi:hypothetical protein [Halonotius roseus]|uniref:Uncharacterized protein n=1 Tax=Halonotius roseus TaxID=2511997 RepID=A0A544QQD3_9EURY|nr:hypothetical protein [Halonotius roseus]TQQ81652.1 hypothetical protein EWF95_01545 [Halonotius roseus]
MSFDEEIVSEYDTPFEAVADHQSIILENTDLLYIALEENLHRVDEIASADTLRAALSRVLIEDSESYESANTVSSAILHSISYYHHYDIPKTINDDLNQWLKKCNIKFEAEIQQSRTKEYVGSEGWTDINTSIEITDSELESINFRHNVKTLEDKFTFVSTSTGLVGLVEHLLEQLKDASGYNALTDEEIERLEDSFEEVVDYHHSENKRSDLLIEALLSNTDLSKEEIAELSEEEIYDRLEQSINEE